MAGRWWRAYNEARDDPKLQRLSGELFKGWFNLMCIASDHDGSLPPVDDLAFKLRMPVPKARKLVDGLVEAGLIDETDGALHPHNWKGRQFKSDGDPTNSERQKRYRNGKRNANNNGNPSVTGTVDNSVTKANDNALPNIHQIQNRDRAEQNRNTRAPNGASVEPDPDADLFRRGKQVLGQNAGGLIADLKRSQDGNISKTRAIIETASTKQDPRQYVGGVIKHKGEEKPYDPIF
jgi:hypothetical protein